MLSLDISTTAAAMALTLTVATNQVEAVEPLSQSWRVGEAVALDPGAEARAAASAAWWGFGPGSDGLPAGLSLDAATGVISGAPATRQAEPRRLVLRAHEAGDRYVDVPVDFVVDGEPPWSESPTTAPLNVGAPSEGVVSGSGPWTVRHNGVGYVRAGRPFTSTPGETYRVRAHVDNSNGGTYNIRIGPDLLVSSGTAVHQFLNNADDAAVEFEFTAAPGTTHVVISAGASGNDSMIVKNLVVEGRNQAASGAVLLSSPPALVADRTGGAVIDIAPYAVNASFLTTANALPEGVGLVGTTIVVAPGAAPGVHMLTLGAGNAAGVAQRSGEPTRIQVSLTVLAQQAEVSALSDMVYMGQAFSQTIAGLFEFTPDAVEAVDALPEGLTLNGATVAGALVAEVDRTGVPVRLRARDATRVQDLVWRVMGGPNIAADLDRGGAWSSITAGVTVTVLDAANDRIRITNTNGGPVFATLYRSIGNRNGSRLGHILTFIADYTHTAAAEGGAQSRIETTAGALVGINANANPVAGQYVSHGSGNSGAGAPNAELRQVFQLVNMPAGGVVDLVSSMVYDREAVLPAVVGDLSERRIHAAPAAYAPWTAETFIDLKKLFAPNTTSVTLEAGQEAKIAGLGLTYRDGIIRGQATTQTSETIAFRGENGDAQTAVQSLTLNATGGAHIYDAASDAFIGALTGSLIGDQQSRVRRTGLRAFRVDSDKGAPELRTRAYETQAGVAYDIAFDWSRGSLPSGATLEVYLSTGTRAQYGNFGSDAVAFRRAGTVAMIADSGAAAIRATAVSDSQWIILRAPGGGAGDWFAVEGLSLTAADAAHASPADGAPVIGTPAENAVRLGNLRHGRRHAISVSAPGASRIRIAATSAAVGALSEDAALPAGVWDFWPATSLTDATFIAQGEVAWVVAEGASSVTVSALSLDDTAWPPAEVSREAGQRWPRLRAYSVPTATHTMTPGQSIAAFVDALPAAGNHVVVLPDGDYTGGTISRRFREPVRVMAESEQGARLTSSLFIYGRNLSIEGLLVEGPRFISYTGNNPNQTPVNITINNAQNIGLKHLVGAGYMGIGAGGADPVYYLDIDDVSVFGGPLNNAAGIEGLKANPSLGVVLALQQVATANIRGTTLAFTRNDFIKASGRFLNFQDTHLAEVYPYSPGVLDQDDHSDHIQSAAFEATPERPVNWWAFRNNFWHDNIAGVTGGVSGFTFSAPSWANQRHGPRGLLMQNSIFRGSNGSFHNTDIADASGPIRIVDCDIPIGTIWFGSLFIGRTSAVVESVVGAVYKSALVYGDVGQGQGLDASRIEEIDVVPASSVRYADSRSIAGYTTGDTTHGARALAAALAGETAVPPALGPNHWRLNPAPDGATVEVLGLPAGALRPGVSVEMRVNGGSWTPLDALTWPDTWRETRTLADGSAVALRLVGPGGPGPATPDKTVVVR